ncbi:hypothetical protein CDO52_02010 [Nocardiopsis gilva YIM 90087]|uniref:Secreted protein n=1 Tax=Nocardiopsis gilva YIM 90087 TaxID=1235441 RepID=A0A223S129_9ACTN|nr:DUF6049 family protein [Nocardiopsis gilva]ASU81729.1 hypothetical protein CDO52_02010 [Nocardiopsis gilva YIM 90087]
MATTAVLVPALAAVAPAQPAAATPATVPRDDSAKGGQALTVEGISPQTVGKKSTVKVTGRVTNTTDDELADVTVRLRYSRYPFSDRSQLSSYASGDGAQPQVGGPKTELDKPLKPGESATYSLKVKAEDMRLRDFGVYPLAVDMTDGSGHAEDTRYTYLPYEGESSPDPVDIAWVWPLMDDPQRADDDTFLSDGLSTSLGPNGRLGRLLVAGAQDDDITLEPTTDASAPPADTPGATPDAEATATDTTEEKAEDGDGGEKGDQGDKDADRVPVTWSVDPALLDDIARLGNGTYQVLQQTGKPTATTGDAAPTTLSRDPSPTAQQWLRQARTGLDGAPIITTPYANADIAALLRQDLRADAEAAVSLGGETVENVLGTEADTSVAWPAGGLMNSETRDFLSERGATTFLLSDTALPARSSHGGTPPAQATLAAGDSGADATALVVDSGLRDALAQPSRGAGDAALASQRFAAETAMIAAEGGDDRTVVAAPPRDWNPGADFAANVLRASEKLPWLDPVALGDIEVNAKDEAQRGRLTYPEKGAQSELTGTYLEEVDEVRKDIRLFNTILTDDTDPFRPAILRLESASWRDDKTTAAQARALVARAVTLSREDVHIIPGETVTLASKTGKIGVLVANDLEKETVTVNLSIYSENNERLSVGKYKKEMTLRPGRKTTVYVPLSARINGRTVLNLSLQNADGEPISEEVPLPVNATGLGTQALLISAIGALILVIALAPRALRKWARKRAERVGGSESAESAGAAGDGTGGGPGGDGDNAPGAMQHNGRGSSTEGERPDGSAGSGTATTGDPASDTS